MEFGLALAILVLALLVSATPALGLPVGLVLGIYVLVADGGVAQAAVLGAAGVALGRGWLALEARRGHGRQRSSVAEANARAMRQFLASSPRYRRTTFLAGATPLVPARFLFPLLGSMGAPLLPALLGTFVGQLPLLALTTWLAVSLARWVTPSDQQAALLLGVTGIAAVLIRLLASIDWEHWRRARRLRMKVPQADPRLQMLMRSLGGSPGTGPGPIPFPGGLFHSERRGADGEDVDLIDVEVEAEEAIDLDGADATDEDADHEPPPLPPASPSSS